MKIDELSKQIGLLSPSSDPASRTRPGGENRTDKSETTDSLASAAKIELSRASVEYGKVAEASEFDQPQRIERINQLKEAIENGQYEVESSRVADKMVLEGLMDILKP